jgi:hypothetical protein
VDLNPFDYSLTQVRQLVTALVVAGISIAAFFIVFDPGFQQAAVVVLGELFAVIGVFASKEHSYDDISKSVTALAGGVISLVGYFATLNPDTIQTILGIVSQLVLFGGVLYGNQGPITPTPVGAKAATPGRV